MKATAPSVPAHTLRHIIYLLLITLIAPTALLYAQESGTQESGTQEAATSAPARQELLQRLFSAGELTASERQAFLQVPRARFLPDDLSAFAEEDRSLPLTGKAVIPSHSLAETFLSLAGLPEKRSVLIVGAGGGYLAALFHAAGWTVHLEEFEPQLLERYRSAWEGLGLTGIAAEPTSSMSGIGADGETYEAVIVHGKVRRIPANLFAMTSPGGILAAPLSDGAGGYLLMAYRNGEAQSIEAIPAELFPASFLAIE
jgi:protein-L-isoaspartate(D-aspartate) O-methyltransferase